MIEEGSTYLGDLSEVEHETKDCSAKNWDVDNDTMPNRITYALLFFSFTCDKTSL